MCLCVFHGRPQAAAAAAAAAGPSFHPVSPEEAVPEACPKQNGWIDGPLFAYDTGDEPEDGENITNIILSDENRSLNKNLNVLF